MGVPPLLAQRFMDGLAFPPPPQPPLPPLPRRPPPKMPLSSAAVALSESGLPPEGRRECVAPSCAHASAPVQARGSHRRMRVRAWMGWAACLASVCMPK